MADLRAERWEPAASASQAEIMVQEERKREVEAVVGVKDHVFREAVNRKWSPEARKRGESLGAAGPGGDRGPGWGWYAVCGVGGRSRGTWSARDLGRGLQRLCVEGLDVSCSVARSGCRPIGDHTDSGQ